MCVFQDYSERGFILVGDVWGFPRFHVPMITVEGVSHLWERWCFTFCGRGSVLHFGGEVVF